MQHPEAHHLDAIIDRERRQQRLTPLFLACLAAAIMIAIAAL
jgi:hypothetical protein